MSAPLVFLDSETTHLNRWLRRPWDIAMIRREPDGTEKRITIFVADVDLSMADPFALAIGRFYERHPQYSSAFDGSGTVQTEKAAATLVEEWTRGAHIVGAVPSFDEDVFAQMLHRHNLLWAGHYHLIDVETLAVGWLQGHAKATPGALSLDPPWKSDDLANLLGVDPPTDEERHTAMGDAAHAQRMYDRIMT